MEVPHNLNRLMAGTEFSSVMPVRSFRAQEGYYQFIDGNGDEYIALDTDHPYGDLDIESLDEAHRKMFLQPEVVDNNFSLFRVPVDMISLKQAIVSQSRNQVSPLKQSLQEAGHIIGALASQAQLPKLRVGDFGINRTDGSVSLLPPVEIHTGVTDRTRAISALAVSLSTVIDHRLTTAITVDLVEAIEKGARG